MSPMGFPRLLDAYWYFGHKNVSERGIWTEDEDHHVLCTYCPRDSCCPPCNRRSSIVHEKLQQLLYQQPPENGISPLHRRVAANLNRDSTAKPGKERKEWLVFLSLVTGDFNLITGSCEHIHWPTSLSQENIKKYKLLDLNLLHSDFSCHLFVSISRKMELYQESRKG
ncbi:unnamed protein product [Cuscuta europaea]|uniref:Uncharacterized protein n=1 Tax=Cuscuta europaea TaxID=41803 RepID=A0A9P0ZVT6_CUSEU|nr:unnamed protein product [Cuscuta europaea]